MTETNPENINKLNVSQSWKKKFELFKQIGADEKSLYKAIDSPEFKGLGFWKKGKVIFNTWAFFFGPFYYFSKKMWAKGTILWGAAFAWYALLFIVEIVAQISLPQAIFWAPVAVIFAQLANYDYYRFVVHKEKVWDSMPNLFSKPVGVVGFLIVAIVFWFGIFAMHPMYASLLEEVKTEMKKTKNTILMDVSGVWRGDTDGAIISISLNGKNKILNINGTEIQVIVKSIDQDKHIITLGVNSVGGQQVFWTLQQLFVDEGSFTLQMTLNDGTHDSLSFVRNL